MKKVLKIALLVFIVLSTFAVVDEFSKSNDATLKRIQDEIVYCNDGELSSENEGKLVLVSGKPYADDRYYLADEEFGIEDEDAVMLHRTVEQYSYMKEEYEVEEYKDGKKFIYDSESDTYQENEKVKRKETKIVKSWHNVKKQDAEKVGKYENPEVVIGSTYFYRPVYLGDFELDIEKIRAFLPYTAYNELSDGENPVIGTYHTVALGNNTYLTTSESEDPQIGDYRISFGFSNFKENQKLTVIGKQIGNTIGEYEDKKLTVYKAYDGEVSVEDILKDIGDDLNGEKGSILIGYIIMLVIGFIVFTGDVVKFFTKKKSRY